MNWSYATMRARRTAHRELFHLSDDSYIVAGKGDNVFDTILGTVDAFNSDTETGPLSEDPYRP